MLNKNKFFRSGYIHFHFFILNSKTNFVITGIPFGEFEFPFPEQGLLLCFSDLKRDPGNPYNQYGIFNELTLLAENKSIRETHYQNSIFLNIYDMVCDAGNSNLFLISGNTLIAPSPETGCINDILRNIILEISEELKLKILESDRITREDVLKSNEVFLAGERNGFQWVMGVETKRFVRHNSVKIYQKLNEFLKEKVS